MLLIECLVLLIREWFYTKHWSEVFARGSSRSPCAGSNVLTGRPHTSWHTPDGGPPAAGSWSRPPAAPSLCWWRCLCVELEDWTGGLSDCGEALRSCWRRDWPVGLRCRPQTGPRCWRLAAGRGHSERTCSPPPFSWFERRHPSGPEVLPDCRLCHWGPAENWLCFSLLCWSFFCERHSSETSEHR